MIHRRTIRPATGGALLPALALSALLLLSVPAGGLAAQSGSRDTVRGPVTPHPEAVEAIGRLRSPFCPGLMLEVCPSPQAAELRDSIQGLAESGVRSDSIVSWMLAEYGQEWRAVPPTEGRGLWAWVMPPLVLVLGIGGVFVALRALRGEGEGESDGEGGQELSEEEERRLADALREMETGAR